MTVFYVRPNTWRDVPPGDDVQPGMCQVEAKNAQRRRPELKVLAFHDRQSDPPRGQAAAELAMGEQRYTSAQPAIGFLVAQVLVRVLSGVFDPPPDTLSIPWPYVLAIFGADQSGNDLGMLDDESSRSRQESGSKLPDSVPLRADERLPGFAPAEVDTARAHRDALSTLETAPPAVLERARHSVRDITARWEQTAG